MSISLSSLLLLITCSLGWAGLDLVRKVLAGRIEPLPLLVLLALGQLPMVGIWAIWEGEWILTSAYWLPGIASAILNVVANVAYLRSVQLSPLSATVPLLALGPVFTSLVAVLLLREIPSLAQAVGIGTVVVGALVLNHRSTDASLWKSLKREPGSPLMMAVALLWAVTLPLDKLAIEASTPAVHSLVLTGLVSVFAIALVGRRTLLLPPKGTWLPFLVAVAIGAVALILQMLVIQVVLVGLVETFKRGLGCFLAVALGRWVFGEKLTPQKIAAVILMATGVALVLL